MLKQEPRTSDVAELQDKVLGLRESINATRMRLSAQRERLARLRSDAAGLRAAAVEAPPEREAAADSAPEAASLPAGVGWSEPARPSRLSVWAPYLALMFTAAVAHARGVLPFPKALFPAESARHAGLFPLGHVEPASLPVPAFPEGFDGERHEGESEALLLAHEWRLDAEGPTLLERLGSGASVPGARPAWTAEQTGERVYRVSFRAAEDSPAYEFDVDLESRRVDPTDEAVELLAPRLLVAR